MGHVYMVFTPRVAMLAKPTLCAVSRAPAGSTATLNTRGRCFSCRKGQPYAHRDMILITATSDIVHSEVEAMTSCFHSAYRRATSVRLVLQRWLASVSMLPTPTFHADAQCLRWLVARLGHA
eukprot:2063610-Alexandrium_andersonii.AAC.1